SGVTTYWTNLLTPPAFGNCTDTLNTIPENNGTIVGLDANVLAPYSIAAWIAQATDRNVPDARGLTIPRGIDGLPPFAPLFTRINLVKNGDGTLTATLNPVNATGRMQLCTGTGPNCTPVGDDVGVPPNPRTFTSPGAVPCFVTFTDPNNVWADSASD